MNELQVQYKGELIKGNSSFWVGLGQKLPCFIQLDKHLQCTTDKCGVIVIYRFLYSIPSLLTAEIKNRGEDI